MSEIARNPVSRRGFEAGSGFDMREAAALAWRQRKTLVAALLAPIGLAVLLLTILPRSYRAESDILVKTGREYLAQVEGESGMSAPTSTKQEGINSEIVLLASRSVAETTIRSIGISNLYPEMTQSSRFSPGRLFGGMVGPASPPGRASIDPSLMDAAVLKFSHDLDVEPVKLSNVISVSFDGTSPQEAETVLNRAIKAYIDKHTQVFADSHAEGYQDSIDHILADMDQLEQKRTKIKLDNGIYDIAAQRSALITQRVDAQSHLQDVITNQATLQKRLAYLANARARIASVTHTTNTDASDEAVHAHEALADLRQSEAAMSARLADTNPDLARVRAQIEALQQNISTTSKSRTSLASVPSALAQQVDQELVMGNAELAPLTPEIARYTQLIKTIGEELRRLEQADLDLRTTGSRIDVLNDNLKTVQEHYDQARTQEQTNLAKQVSVVQVAPAIAAEKAVFPRKIVFLAGGLLLGLLAASGMFVLSLIMKKTVLTSQGLERVTGLPVLATVPFRAMPAGLRLG